MFLGSNKVIAGKHTEPEATEPEDPLPTLTPINTNTV